MIKQGKSRFTDRRISPLSASGGRIFNLRASAPTSMVRYTGMIALRTVV